MTSPSSNADRDNAGVIVTMANRETGEFVTLTRTGLPPRGKPHWIAEDEWSNPEIGERFGRIVVKAQANPSVWAGKDKTRSDSRVVGRCDCGTEKVFMVKHLRSGATTSCGCIGVERVSRKGQCHPGFKHGMTRTATYQSWRSMIQRCKNPKAANWSNYGGRGITVCDRWLAFSNFLADMGERPKGLSLDRIDVNGHYEPRNCRWATAQSTYNDKTKGRWRMATKKNTPRTPSHRITLTEIVERQLAMMTSASNDRSGIKLTLNARGETQVEVKVSVGEPGTNGTMEGAQVKAEAIYDALTEKYNPAVRKARGG